MNTLAFIMIGMALGIVTMPAIGFISSKIQRRLNYGAPVRFNQKKIGHVVVCRYDGVKRFFYTNEMGELIRERAFFTSEDAENACKEAHLDYLRMSRPKQTTFARTA
jgi:hypothetical protein